MNHINVHLEKRCLESMISSYDQLILIPGIMDIVEASNHGRGLMLNIKSCKHEIAKLGRGETEAAKVGLGD